MKPYARQASVLWLGTRQRGRGVIRTPGAALKMALYAAGGDIQRRGTKPMRYGSPAKAIEAMERRLAQLKRDKAKTLETLADCDESVRRKVEEALAELNHQIEAAQHRLDAYKFQQRHEN